MLHLLGSEPQLATLLALCGFAFLAGFIDSVVGGGGLIQIPALFVLLPGLPAATVFGTNKFAAIWGTLSATLQYARRVPIPWRAVLPAGAAAAACSFLGAHAVSLIGNAALKPMILALLVAVLGYTLWKKDFGALHAPKLGPAQQFWIGLATGAVIGFYDGFFGPGTGTFFAIAFARWGKHDLLGATARAKILNLSTNLGALAAFVWAGRLHWKVGLSMTALSIAGNWVGAHLGVRRGAAIIRPVVVLVCAGLFAKVLFDALR